MKDPRTSPVLVLDFEGGTDSIAGTGAKTVRIKTTDELTKMFNWIAAGSHPFKSIGVDSLTEIHQKLLLDIMTEAEKGRRPADAGQPQQQDYLKAIIRMRKIVRSFRDLPYHILFTGLLKEETDPKEGLVKKPAFPGQFAEEIGGILDVMGYLAVGNTRDNQERRLTVQPTGGIRAKFRTPEGVKAPAYVVDPTISKLLDIKEALNGKAS